MSPLVILFVLQLLLCRLRMQTYDINDFDTVKNIKNSEMVLQSEDIRYKTGSKYDSNFELKEKQDAAVMEAAAKNKDIDVNAVDFTWDTYSVPEDFIKSSEYIDLTNMPIDMAYAILYRINYFPDEYEGKTIRIFGAYSESVFENNKYYFCNLINSLDDYLGIEFIKTEYNNPKPNDAITIEGKIEVYYEEHEDHKEKYVHLTDVDFFRTDEEVISKYKNSSLFEIK